MIMERMMIGNNIGRYSFFYTNMYHAFGINLVVLIILNKFVRIGKVFLFVSCNILEALSEPVIFLSIFKADINLSFLDTMFSFGCLFFLK